MIAWLSFAVLDLQFRSGAVGSNPVEVAKKLNKHELSRSRSIETLPRPTLGVVTGF
jgi:hypothetical protein